MYQKYLLKLSLFLFSIKNLQIQDTSCSSSGWLDPSKGELRRGRFYWF